MKNELGEEIMTEFVRLKPKTHSYLIDDDSSDKKVRGTKKYAIIRRLESEGHKHWYPYVTDAFLAAE